GAASARRIEPADCSRVDIEKRARLRTSSRRARVSAGDARANVGRSRWHAERAQQALVHIALGDEANAIPPGVLPLLRVLAGIRATRAQHPIGACGAPPGAGPVAAHVNDDRARLPARAVTTRM